jgi:uncharacterized protein (DUF169 family)
MTLNQAGFDILRKMEFDFQPIAVKFFVRRPEKIDRLDQKMTFCEMLVKAQDSDPFYVDSENHTCGAGLYVLGQTDIEEQYISGEFGTGLGAFRDNRAANRLYHYIPKIERQVVNYVVFSPLNNLTFEPDILLCLADIDQAEILLRAMSYNNGQMWSSRYSSAIGCAWLLIYPYLSGEINFISTGLGFGMKRRNLFPKGMQFISIPFDRLENMLKTLEEMPWTPEPYKPGGFEYVRQLRVKIGLEQ